MEEKPQVTWHQHNVSREERETLKNHQGCIVWFTGLSGSGKSTIANLVERQLLNRSVHTFLLDGDNVRHGLNAAPDMLEEHYGHDFARRFGLGFSAEDREENIRRIGSVAELFCQAGLVTLTAFVSPYRRDRDEVRARLDGAGRQGDFFEIYVDTPLAVCENRDPKGLYKRARAGEIQHFTGIDDPYEPPRAPELVLDGAKSTPQELSAQVVRLLGSLGKI
jgi:adenylylsulfate kinase